MDEFLKWLNSDRVNREIQISLETSLTKLKNSHNAVREEGVDELVHLVRGLKDARLEAFLTLQDIQEFNVAQSVMNAMMDKNFPTPFRADALVGALDILQGCCLLHYPSKGLVGIDNRAIKLMLSRLETFCRMYGGKLVEKTAKSATRVPLNKRASSLVDTAALDPLVIISCLDCLLAILVDHDLCQVEFRQQQGIAFLVDVINATSAPKDVRAKAAEFLLFLVRYFTESKDDHQQQVSTYLGDKMFKALTDSAQATGKGPEKFDTFLKQIDLNST
jgi:hypothetical protein